MEIKYFDFNEKIKKDLHKSLINGLICKIYDFKIQGIDETFYDYFILDNKRIIMTQVQSARQSNIKIIIIELNFLRTKSDTIKHNFYTYCVECGKIHAQHRYKTCGHHVNYLCAYGKLTHNNKCAQCNKNIIKHELKLVKSDKTETCSICLDECNTVLPECGHHFHKKCMKTFCNSKNEQKCPMCRQDIVPLKNYTIYHKNLTFSLPQNRSGFVDIMIQTL